MPSILLSDNGVSSGSAGIKTTGGNDGVLALQTTTSGGTATTAVYITNTQLVGIGTTSPATDAQLTISADLEPTLFFQRAQGGNNDAAIQVSSGGAILFKNGADSSTAAGLTERARIDSSGNLLVGTTSSLTGGRSAFWATTAVPAAEFRVNAASSDSTQVIAIIKSSTTNTTAQVLANFAINNGGTGAGQINCNGAGAAAFGSFSDQRLKENIVDLPPQLSNIMALRPVEFDYIESEGGGHQVGFIAQEMQTVYPDAIGERAPDNMLSITGWSKTEARLVKAIQEQQALITTLTERITALEGAK